MIGNIQIEGSLTGLEQRLSDCSDNFVRINSGYLVNLSQVIGIIDREVQLSNGESIPVSRPRKTAFKEAWMLYVDDKFCATDDRTVLFSMFESLILL